MRKLSADPSFQPFRNYALNPDPVDLAYWSTNVGPDVATTSFDSATARIPGRGSFKCTSINGVQFNAQLWDGTTTPLTPVVPGQMVRHAVWVKTSGANINVYPVVRWRASDMSNPATTSLASVVVGQSWTRVIFQGAAPVGAAWAHLSWTVNALAVGQFAWFVEAVSVVDMPLPDVAPNGTTPGWKWAGTAARSTPIGYPYTLESIAGKPVADLSGVNQSVNLVGGLYTGPITIYATVDRNDPTLGDWGSANIGVNANGTGFSKPTGFAMQQSGSGTTNGWQSRLDTSAATNQTSGQATGPGRHVYVAQFDPSIGTVGSRKLISDGGAASVFNGDVGTGVELYRFTTGSGAVYVVPVRALLYLAAHNTETIKRITAWLARAHGSPIPAGY